MAKEAERLLADTGWLPEPLRLTDLDGGPTVGATADEDGGDEALPAFLTDDEEEDPADAEGDEPAVIAAE